MVVAGGSPPVAVMLAEVLSIRVATPVTIVAGSGPGEDYPSYERCSRRFIHAYQRRGNRRTLRQERNVSFVGRGQHHVLASAARERSYGGRAVGKQMRLGLSDFLNSLR